MGEGSEPPVRGARPVCGGFDGPARRWDRRGQTAAVPAVPAAPETPAALVVPSAPAAPDASRPVAYR
ncbi:hypothetical protein EST54_28485 [Streptomyces sioyaensis]|uniref:Uncharacterized protein n=1 Tax=Streptomyces sioyaensis TaxID=67364 RepID=A0A4Q1QUI9_9ACTN|nr:hypothetical protein EST54_28485 [Streptomyces sioyaensis]